MTKKNLKPRTHPIFVEIGKRLNDMSGSAVQLAIKRRMNEIFTKQELGIDENEAIDANEPAAQQELDISNASLLEECAIIIQLTDVERRALQIVKVKYADRSRLRLGSGWPDALFKVLALNGVANCPYNFHRGDVKDGEFSTTALCNECQSSINIKSMYDRTQIQLKMDQKAESECTGFRRVTTHKANEIAKQLKSKTVYEVYHQQSQSIPDDATKLPPDFVTQKNISKIKVRHEAVDGTTVYNLRLLKYSTDGSIKELATDPFVVIFWTKQQMHLYAQASTQEITLDAMDALVKNESLFTDLKCCMPTTPRSPHIFLYLISVKTDAESIPVGQMLSAQQDSIRISYFFDRWLQDFKLPK